MNIEKLKVEEERFLERYPGGFSHPDMLKAVKKHHISKYVDLVATHLSQEAFEDTESALNVIVKIISGSSLVSVFEKTAFRNMVHSLSFQGRETLVSHYFQLLYEDQEKGFENLAQFLSNYKNSKWPVLTALLYYSNPMQEVIIKPTSVKLVIEKFELDHIQYTSKPNYAFYSAYRDCIHQMKKASCEALQIENGAYSGFLMFAIGMFHE